ncbi:hypothetical protein RI138_15400 [Streptomyces sp. C11-1]|uniref:Hydrolase n=1 Tax=Streptomyces durocortorensis TaxID=2811104 RepID=A0ABY9VWV1_9ACTN|nr:hypothetical protein [Streptomyces durocortorensis]WNF28103.1 hypothetical protein RI138_15400 [Streptomyces durocortorensis]
MIIAFDLMDTLLSDPYRSAYEQAFGITYEEFERVRPQGAYHQLECGELAEEDYWAAMRDAGLSFDTDVFHRTRRSGYAWLKGMRELVAECAREHRTVVASNYPRWIEEIERDMLAGTGLEVYASYRFGVRKPSERFFRLLGEETGTGPHDLVLIDDMRANTDTVTALGGIGIPFASAHATRQQLLAHGLLPG